MDAELEKKRDREAIVELKARYCRFMDTKHWSACREPFTEDPNAPGQRGLVDFALILPNWRWPSCPRSRNAVSPHANFPTSYSGNQARS